MSKAYDEKAIVHLAPMEHIRKRPGMYIGRLGNGTSPNDGIYILLKEALDNSIDEFVMGHGDCIKVIVSKNEDGTQTFTVQDFGRGIPLGAVDRCVAQINTGAKYNSDVFKKSGGMNGVGIKAVNALSSQFAVLSVRDGKEKRIEYSAGKLVKDHRVAASKTAAGTTLTYTPDASIFSDYSAQEEFIERMLFQYACLNPGIKIELNFEGNEKSFYSENGLPDLIHTLIKEGNSQTELKYPLVYLQGENIIVAISHTSHYGEEIHSFVNGQHTSEGGTHVAALREGVVKVIREVLKKNFEAQDIRTGLIAAISIRIDEPIFESQTKTKLGSIYVNPNSENKQTIRNFIVDFLSKEYDSELRKSPQIIQQIQEKITQAELERKELAGIREKTREISKRVKINNPKLRDCEIHWNSTARAHRERRHETTLFIVEGDSAAGPITKARDMKVQAVFPLRGKPYNCFGKSKRAIYDNEELHLLQSALGIEDGIEGLRYRNIVLATDADVDGMHIRMLMVTFFLQYYPELVKEGHIYVLQTPLFRVRNKKETKYCYNDSEKAKAINSLGPNPEITRFKGLGEISDHEFGDFIGKKIRLEPVILGKNTDYNATLRFYMGSNNEERQQFICQNLRETTV